MGEKKGWRRVHGEEGIAVGGERSGDDRGGGRKKGVGHYKAVLICDG